MNGVVKENLSRWLPLAIALLALAVSWGVQRESIDNIEGIIQVHNEEISDNSDRLNSLESQSAAIETDLAWIKTALIRIESRMIENE